MKTQQKKHASVIQGLSSGTKKGPGRKVGAPMSIKKVDGRSKDTLTNHAPEGA